MYHYQDKFITDQSPLPFSQPPTNLPGSQSTFTYHLHSPVMYRNFDFDLAEAE